MASAGDSGAIIHYARFAALAVDLLLLESSSFHLGLLCFDWLLDETVLINRDLLAVFNLERFTIVLQKPLLNGLTDETIHHLRVHLTFVGH